MSGPVVAPIPPPDKDDRARMVDMIWKIVTILILPWAMWMSLQVVELQTQVAVIKSNRFTSADGQDVWKAMATRPTRVEIEGKYPPPWLVNRVEDLESWQQRHTEERRNGGK